MSQSTPPPLKTPRPAPYAILLCLLHLTLPTVFAQTPSPANAADLYKQASDLLSHLTDAEQNTLKSNQLPDRTADAFLYSKIQPIMACVRTARNTPTVDWHLPPPSFTSVDTPAQIAQSLARLIHWEAEYRFISDPNGAVSDIAAMETMGRRTGDFGLIGVLVQGGIHAMGIRLLAQNAPGITSAAAPDLAFITNPAASRQAFEKGIIAEASLLQTELDTYANPATRNQSTIQKMAPAATSPEAMISQLKWLHATELTFSTTIMQPEPQFQQWWAGKLSEAAQMPLAKQDLASLVQVREMSRATISMNAMLTAGIALVQHNQALFQFTLDPISAKPFTLTQTPTGFQLISTQTYKGKPVTLDFPAPTLK